MVEGTRGIGELWRRRGREPLRPLPEDIASQAQKREEDGWETVKDILALIPDIVAEAGLYALLVRGGDYLSAQIIRIKIPKGKRGGEMEFTITLGTLITLLIIWRAYAIVEKGSEIDISGEGLLRWVVEYADFWGRVLFPWTSIIS
ncbi:MAG: hypothetical protein DRI93_04410 [Aquificota bacterium]|nr:MAG: hypothetical protein DRI93_04410 [Aquificota bacterium]